MHRPAGSPIPPGNTFHRLLRAAAVASLAAAALAAPGASSGQTADEKKACFASYEKAQELRKQGSLKASKEQMMACSKPACPKALRADCTKWIEEVQSSMPTVVIEGRDTAGNETILVKVSVDGKVVTERLDGRAIEVDPGQHTFKFEYGASAIEEKVVIREGEHNRKLLASFAPKTPPPPAGPVEPGPKPKGSEGTATSRPPPPPPGQGEGGEGEASSRPVPVVTYVFGGLTVLGAAGFATFGLMGKGKANDLKSSCLPNCSTSEVDKLKRTYLIGDISLGIGIVSLGVAAITYVTRPRVPASEARLTLDVAPTQGGAAAMLGGSF